MEKFQCSMCGKCCRETRGLGTDSEMIKEKRENYEFLLKHSPIYPFNKLEEEGMMLFEWEIEKLRKLASSKGIKLYIKPRQGLLSASGTVIIVSWMLDHDVCPFLQDNKCSIYEDRPYVCQSFPLYKSFYDVIREDEPKKAGLGYLVDCPKVIHVEEFQGQQMRVRDMIKKSYEVYGETLLGSMRYDFAKDMVESLTEELIKRGYIYPTKVSISTFLKKYERGSLSLFQFMLRNRLITQKDIDDMSKTIKDFASKYVKDALDNNDSSKNTNQ